MSQREWIKVGIGACCIGLFVLILLVVMNFRQIVPVVDLTPEPQEEVVEFQNSSSMSEQELRLFIEEKRMELKDFFETAQIYSISEVADGYTKADDDAYLVVDASFLNRLRELLTVDAYGMFWNEFEEITPKSDINLSKSRLYKSRRDLFDFVYVTSAIPKFDVSEEILILKNATDEKIEACINIRLCEEENQCTRNDKYNFILEQEDDIWKIADFTTLVH